MAALIATSQSSGTPTSLKLPNYNKLPVSGDALGWHLCDYKGHPLYMHGGGFAGVRTQMSFSPDLEIGIAAAINSDAAIGWLTGRVVIQCLQYLLDDPQSNAMAGQRVRRFSERVDEQLIDRRQRRNQRLLNFELVGCFRVPVILLHR